MNTQTSQLNQTASIIRSAKALLVVSAFVMAPAMHADCLPTVPLGGSVPFYLSTHNVATHAVGYSAGTLTDSGTTFSVLSGNQFPQSFSDRFAPLQCTYCLGNSWPADQNFSVTSLDQIGLSITRTLAMFGHPSSISITLTLDSWGNNKTTFTGVCDAATNLLYGSYGGNTMAVISFGAPQGPLQ